MNTNGSFGLYFSKDHDGKLKITKTGGKQLSGKIEGIGGWLNVFLPNDAITDCTINDKKGLFIPYEKSKDGKNFRPIIRGIYNVGTTKTEGSNSEPESEPLSDDDLPF